MGTERDAQPPPRALHSSKASAVQQPRDVATAQSTEAASRAQRPPDHRQSAAGAAPGVGAARAQQPLKGGARKALLLFAGDVTRDERLAVHLYGEGFTEVEEVDIKSGGNLLDAATARSYIERIKAGEFAFVFISPPCKSFSVANIFLRHFLQPYGVTPIPPEWRDYLERHNFMALFSFEAIGAAHTADVVWMLEHPASRRHGPAKWPAFAERASIWDLDEAIASQLLTGGVKATLAQCAYSSAYQKWTTLYAARRCEGFMRKWLSRPCACVGKHAKVAKGRDADGFSLSEPAAEYPPEMSRLVARMAAEATADNASCSECGDSSSPPSTSGASARASILGAPRPHAHARADGVSHASPHAHAHVSDGPHESASPSASVDSIELDVYDAGSGTDASGTDGGVFTDEASPGSVASMDVDMLEHERVGVDSMDAVEYDASDGECSGVLAFGDELVVGSDRPHHAGGAAPPQAPAHRGSLRQLEPELFETLIDEPLPATNLSIVTDPEDPPSQPDSLPGPFTDEQLIPPGVKERVEAYGKRVRALIERATRGSDGWRVARDLREQPLILTEAEALNPCGHGFRWRRGEDGRWHAIRPSAAEVNPPGGDVDAVKFDELAQLCGSRDHQLRSWVYHGFPGAPDMPVFAQIAPPHVGALKHASVFKEIVAKDGKLGHVTFGFEFPDVWPCVVDPMNVVMQRGKGRVAIDKTMLVSGDYELPSFNLTLDLDAIGNRYLLVRISTFTRACAILETALVGVIGILLKIAKFDLEKFFRKHAKQHAHLHQSGRLTHEGFGTDGRVNFGECNAPDNTGRVSNELTLFVRHELRRLQREYAPRDPALRAWLARRAALSNSESAEFTLDVLFFVWWYVDDAGLAVIDDLLFDHRGEPVFVLLDDGVTRVHQGRAQLFVEAAIGVIEYVGHKAPLDKRDGPGRALTLVGYDIDLDSSSRTLEEIKALRYIEDIDEALDGATLRGAAVRISFDELNKLVHRLLYASECIVLMRPHLHHLLKALRSSTRLVNRDLILGGKAIHELKWCRSALAEHKLHKLPLASRSLFPGADEPGVLTFYGDASREVNEATSIVADSSGGGAWCVIGGVFYYVERRWLPWEATHFSINILELYVELVALVAFTLASRQRHEPVTHVNAFCDNTSAEFVSERARTHADGMNELNRRRQQFITQHLVHMRTSRVPSIFNDIADKLSRGDLEDALRIPRECNLTVVRLEWPTDDMLSLSEVPPTWA